MKRIKAFIGVLSASLCVLMVVGCGANPDIPDPETTAAPTASPDAGAYTDSVTVTLSCATSGAAIYYTTDNSAPSTSSSLYTEPLVLNADATIRAIAVKDGMEVSEELNAYYTVSPAFNSAPVAGFTHEVSGFTLTVNAANSCSDPEDDISTLEVRWDWTNDGIWDVDWTTTKVQSHLFSSPGQYSVKMEVRDPKGLYSTAVAYVNIASPPTSAFSATMTDLTLSVDASSSTDELDDTSALAVRWDWTSDGTWDTDWTLVKTANYTYPSAGTYTVTVQVRNLSSQTSTASRSVTATEP